MHHAKTVVAIPVRNEAARIGDCLDALALQRDARVDAVVLLLNNCTDDTSAVVRRAAGSFPGMLHPVEHDFAPDEANAGCARAMATDIAAELAGRDGVLLTTDADGRAAPDWLAATLAAFRAGADAVAGRAVIDPVEAKLIPQALHDDDARECAYAALLDQITSLLDPDPADPWPRHTEESGASLAVTTEWYRRVGGMPRVRLGEDRAFAAALRRHDARLRHAPEVWVTVSGRIEGRATGGMADTIRRRLSSRDAFIDDRLEPAAEATRRARLRYRTRRVFKTGGAVGPIADLLGLSRDHLAMLLEGAHFGAAWTAIEAAAPSLRRRLVPVTRLAHETRVARTILDDLLVPAGLSTPVYRADTLAHGPS